MLKSILVKTSLDLDNLISYIENGAFEYCALDTETDSVEEKKATLYGIGLAFEPEKAFYIPIRDKNGNNFWKREAEEDIKHLIAACTKHFKILGHNIIYDALVIENNWDLDISDSIYADTILMKHCLDEDKPFGLKEVAVKYLGPWANKAQKDLYDNIEKNGGSTTKTNLQMFKADTDVLGTYCCWDVMLTFKLFQLFQPMLEKEGLLDLFYKDEVMPLYKEVTINMKRKGFNIDVGHFNQLKTDLEREINLLEDVLIGCSEVAEIEAEILEEKVPLKPGPSLNKFLFEACGLEAPSSFAKSKLQKLPKNPIIDWILEDSSSLDVPAEIITTARRNVLLSKKSYQNQRYLFNYGSNDQVARLLCGKLGFEPEDTTETGKPKIDDKFINSLLGKWEYAQTLIDYKKLNKILSTYVEGILDRQIDGVIYTSMLQFGTTSGRYASRNPNCQNLPRIKEDDSGLSELVLKYANKIKEGMISPTGYSIVNSDYTALEPVCFAAACGDTKLIDVFVKNEDLYSSIAINVFGVEGCSADKKSPNFLKNKHPELRQLSKVFTLAVVYGAEAIRIAQIMKIEKEEAQNIIDQYLDAYPGLKDYMESKNREAKTLGYVKTKFGRIRHLPQAKRLYAQYGNNILNAFWAKKKGLSDERRTMKNLLNNAKNFPIQGLAAHIVNRAMIAVTRKFKEENLDAYVALQIHDEITCIARDDQAERAKTLLREAMEKTIIIQAPLKAEPLIAKNMAEAK